MKAVIGSFGVLAALIIALILGLLVLTALVLGLTRLFGGGEDQSVRSLVEEVQTAALAGLNRRNPNALDDYFATTTEGAQTAGLTQTQQAYKDFIAELTSNDSVQFHSFDIQTVEVHQETKLAKVTYRLHFSVIRNGIVIFGAKTTQALALLKTPRGWRISGGDGAQLEDVNGPWPPR
jgi:hypothetical protein